MALHRDEQVEQEARVSKWKRIDDAERERYLNSSKDYYDLRGRDTNENLSIRHDQPSILPGLDRNSIWSHLILAAQQLINESDPSFIIPRLCNRAVRKANNSRQRRESKSLTNLFFTRARKNPFDSLFFVPFRSTRYFKIKKGWQSVAATDRMKIFFEKWTDNGEGVKLKGGKIHARLPRNALSLAMRDKSVPRCECFAIF